MHNFIADSFFSAFKIFKGDPTPANILFRRTLCGHVTESRTALCFRNSRLNWPKLLILNSVGILRYCFRFLFHSVQKSTPFKPFNLMRWVWSQQKNKNQELFHPDIPRIASCEFDIFPHLKDKLTSVPLTGVLKDRLRETPGRVNYSVYRLRTRTHSVCAQFLYILT